MKTLKEIIEASILDIEGTLNMDIDINLLFSAKSQDQFNQYAKTLKTIIENSAKGPISYKQLKKDGTILVLDTGYSDDMSIKKHKDLIEIADYYTPNIDETEKMTGTRDPQKALDFLRNYFEKPIVKLGKDGCAGYDNGYFTVDNIDEFKCVDATGAGDAFLAGFIYGVYNDLDFKQCVLAGNITGGKCVTGVGCLTEYVNEKEIGEYLKKYGYMIR